MTIISKLKTNSKSVIRFFSIRIIYSLTLMYFPKINNNHDLTEIIV